MRSEDEVRAQLLEWARYEATFAAAASRENWEALLATVDLVRLLATEVASHLSFPYPSDTDAKVSRYIRRLHDRAVDPG